MKTLPERKISLKKEVNRVRKMLNKNNQINFSISWNRKRKHNKIQTKDIAQLKENGICSLIGIVYFTVTGDKTLLIGQTMLLLDANGKEISCTSFFIKQKRIIELSYSWDNSIGLLAISILECIRDSNEFISKRL